VIEPKLGKIVLHDATFSDPGDVSVCRRPGSLW
jgi:hypothetical protein